MKIEIPTIPIVGIRDMAIVKALYTSPILVVGSTNSFGKRPSSQGCITVVLYVDGWMVWISVLGEVYGDKMLSPSKGSFGQDFLN